MSVFDVKDTKCYQTKKTSTHYLALKVPWMFFRSNNEASFIQMSVSPTNHSLSLSLTVSVSLSLPLSLAHSFSLFHSLSLPLPHPLSFFFPLSPSLSLLKTTTHMSSSFFPEKQRCKMTKELATNFVSDQRKIIFWKRTFQVTAESSLSLLIVKEQLLHLTNCTFDKEQFILSTKAIESFVLIDNYCSSVFALKNRVSFQLIFFLFLYFEIKTRILKIFHFCDIRAHGKKNPLSLMPRKY